ncbi:hypothetical protein RHMOL_Rhmol08G0023300 [Rhododendron molle]|uniref:Uncharacterized protein n=1 Tax=Rhododendron molle TaxID=49168 RepID=A0ACC0MIT3_RHOML|nr:hypothetical protein RHMOL_Rhmol08G0023300 [Rhododendron molle]
MQVDAERVVSRDKKRGGQGRGEAAAHSACMAQQEGAAEAADEKMAKDLLFISPLWALFPNHDISKLVFRSTLQG